MEPLVERVRNVRGVREPAAVALEIVERARSDHRAACDALVRLGRVVEGLHRAHRECEQAQDRMACVVRQARRHQRAILRIVAEVRATLEGADGEVGHALTALAEEATVALTSMEALCDELVDSQRTLSEHLLRARGEEDAARAHEATTRHTARVASTVARQEQWRRFLWCLGVSCGVQRPQNHVIAAART